MKYRVPASEPSVERKERKEKGKCDNISRQGTEHSLLTRTVWRPQVTGTRVLHMLKDPEVRTVPKDSVTCVIF